MDIGAFNDEDLLRLAVAGDEVAFTALYRRRQGAIYRFALQMGGSPQVAEDVTQEVFLAVARDGGRFDPARGTVSAFLFGVARNHVLRRLERERVFVQLPDSGGDADSGGMMFVGPDPLEDLTRGETVERVRTAVLALPAHYREAVVLCDLNEMSYAEAAEIIGCAIGTVRSRLHRARSMLIERLRGKNSDEASPAGDPAGCFA